MENLGMGKKKDIKWSEVYSGLLKNILTLYSIDKFIFTEKTTAKKDDVRQWLTGSRFPPESHHDNICNVLKKHISDQKNSILNNKMKGIIKNEYNYLYTEIEEVSPDIEVSELIFALLKVCYFKGKLKSSPRTNKPDPVEISDVKNNVMPANTFESTGKTQVVVFDFDGTLTKGNTIRTRWESIWTELKYDIGECQELHAQFVKGDFSHAEWCKKTEIKFKKRNLNKETLLKIARKIKLLDGCKETFEELERRNIKIYIVSGSILDIIQEVLKPIYHRVDEVKANNFKFSADGLLTEIIGTDYDFEGKAKYIQEIAANLRISTDDILFVGNSRNDLWAHESGAKTLCINPRQTYATETDETGRKVWHDTIEECTDLRKIFEYIHPVSKIITIKKTLFADQQPLFEPID
jgi:HAD superfamily phosphoserine phosphatase-like hydrolase